MKYVGIEISAENVCLVIFPTIISEMYCYELIQTEGLKSS